MRPWTTEATPSVYLSNVKISLFQQFPNDEDIGCCAITSDVILGSGNASNQWCCGMLNLLKKRNKTDQRRVHCKMVYHEAHQHIYNILVYLHQNNQWVSQVKVLILQTILRTHIM